MKNLNGSPMLITMYGDDAEQLGFIPIASILTGLVSLGRGVAKGVKAAKAGKGFFKGMFSFLKKKHKGGGGPAPAAPAAPAAPVQASLLPGNIPPVALLAVPAVLVAVSLMGKKRGGGPAPAAPKVAGRRYRY